MAILTDPPTILTHTRKDRVQFGGTFLTIYSLQKALEEQGLSVEIYIVVSDDSLMPESTYRLIGGSGSQREAVAEPVSHVVSVGGFGAFVLSLARTRMGTILPKLLEALGTGPGPHIFVTAGPRSSQGLKERAADSEKTLHVVERLGVVRITRKAIEHILLILQPNERNAPHPRIKGG